MTRVSWLALVLLMSCKAKEAPPPQGTPMTAEEQRRADEERATDAELEADRAAGRKVKLTDPGKARELARTIAQDISNYRGDRLKPGMTRAELLAAVQGDIDQGRELWKGRVAPQLASQPLFDQAVDEIVITPRLAKP
jgi:hypothetical protein